MTDNINVEIWCGEKLPKVEKDIPTTSTVQSRIIDFLSQMDVGDSFVLPNGASIEYIYAAAKLGGMKVKREKQQDGFRIWRTK